LVFLARTNEQVKRNTQRFPPDFMFLLSREEHACQRIDGDIGFVRIASDPKKCHKIEA
jgi:ORF6N domain